MSDVLFGFLFLAIFLVLMVGTPFALIASIGACVACHRTRKWQKEKTRREANPDADVEMNALVEEEEDTDLDSEDEAQLAAEKEEESPDWDLTPRQKFRKEFKKAMKGKNVAIEAKKREREERAKVAKAVAKQILRMERRRQRREEQASSSSGQTATNDNEDSLPSYNHAVSVDRKG